MSMTETSDQAAQAIRTRHQYEDLIAANEHKFVVKGFSEWSNLIFSSNLQQYQWLVQSATRFNDLNNQYMQNKANINDVFYKFEYELDGLIRTYMNSFNLNSLNPYDAPVLEQAAAAKWFIDYYKKLTYMEGVRSQLFNNQRKSLIDAIGVNQEGTFFAFQQISKNKYIEIKRSLNLIGDLRQIQQYLVHNQFSLNQINDFISNLQQEWRANTLLKLRTSVAMKKIRNDFSTGFITFDHNGALQEIIDKFIPKLNNDIAASKLTINQFERLSIADVQRLAISSSDLPIPNPIPIHKGPAGSLSRADLFALARAVRDDFGNNVMQQANWLKDIIINNGPGTMLHEFSQTEFETKFDFLKLGHCLSYSFLYILKKVIGGSNEVTTMFSKMHQLLNLYDYDTFWSMSDNNHKQLVDSYRTVLSGFYEDFYSNQLRGLINNNNRPQNYPDRNQVMPLSHILDELTMTGTSKRKSALIRTGNHALAVSYTNNGHFEFFDPNAGVFKYLNRNDIEVSLNNFFYQMARDYNVHLTQSGQSVVINLNADFVNENLAHQILSAPIGASGTRIQQTQFSIVTTHMKDSIVNNVLQAQNFGQILQRELPQEIQRGILDSNWIPDFNSARQISNGQWKLSFVHKLDKSVPLREITISSGLLQSALAYIKKQGKKMREAFTWNNGKMKSKSSISNEIHISGMEGLNMLGVIQMIVRAASAKAHHDLKEHFNNPLAVGLEIFAWANVAQSSLQTSVDIIHTGLSIIDKEGPIIGNTLSSLSKVSKGLGAVGTLAGGVVVGLDIYELNEAVKNDNSVAIASAATSLAFDTTSFGLGAGGYIIGGTVGSFAGMLSVPLAGLSIGMGALVSQIEGNFQQCLFTARHLYKLGMAYENGGYYLDKATGMLIPYFGSAISEINLEKKTITFGQTLIPENRVPQDFEEPNIVFKVISEIASPSTHPKILDKFIDWREAFGVKKTINMKESSNAIVLPVTGNSKIKYSFNSFLTTISLRNDGELQRLDKVFVDTGRRFAFRHWQDIAIQAFEQNYQNTEVNVVLGNTSTRLYMPPYSDYPQDIGHIGGGGFTSRMGQWDMHYILEGKGSTYLLTINKGARVTLNEHMNVTKSTFVIHIESGSLLNDQSIVFDGNSLRIDGIQINIKFPHLTTVMVYKKNGELWLYDIAQKKATIVEVDRSWAEKHLNNLTDSLAKLAEDNQVKQILLADIPPNADASEVTKMRGVYFAQTHQLIAEDEEFGIMYELKDVFLPLMENFWGVTANWKKNFADRSKKNLIDQLEDLAKSNNNKIIHLWGVQIKKVNQQYLSITQYIVGSKQLLGVSEYGKVYLISQKDNPRIVAFNQNVYENRQNSLPTIDNSIKTLEVSLQKQNEWINTFKNILINESLSPIISIYGKKTVKNLYKQSDQNELSSWYDVKNDQFIIAGGIYNQTLQYISQGDGFAWLFDERYGEIFTQIPLDSRKSILFDLAPTAHQCFQNIGKIVSIVPGNDKIFITNSDDMTFEVNNDFEAVLVRKGQKCRLSWIEMKNQIKAGHYKIADLVYTYGTFKNNYFDSMQYWYHSPTATKFLPLNMNANVKDISDYEYIGYSSLKGGIYLFNRKEKMLWLIGTGGAINNELIENVIRLDDTVGIDGLLPSDSKLPQIDNVETIVLHLSKEQNEIKIYFHQKSYSRVVISIVNDGVINELPTKLTITLKDVTLNDLNTKFTVKKIGDNTELTDGKNMIVFNGGRLGNINPQWTLKVLASDGVTSQNVQLANLLTSNRLKRSVEKSLPFNTSNEVLETNADILINNLKQPLSWISNWLKLQHNNDNFLHSENATKFKEPFSDGKQTSMVNVSEFDFPGSLQLITMGILKLTGHQYPSFRENKSVSVQEAQIYAAVIANKINCLIMEAVENSETLLDKVDVDHQMWESTEKLQQNLRSAFIQEKSIEEVIDNFIDKYYSNELSTKFLLISKIQEMMESIFVDENEETNHKKAEFEQSANSDSLRSCFYTSSNGINSFLAGKDKIPMKLL